MRKPIIRELLKERDIIVGGCQQILDPLVTECIAQSGVDFVFMDLEHTGRSIDALQCCFLAAAAANVATLVRVRDIRQDLIEQALDAGAQGIIVPTVETVEQCELVASAGRFPPEGTRGWCPVVPPMRWMNDYNPATWAQDANRDVFLGVLIETPLAFKNLPELVKVKGIDFYFLGPGDCSIHMGKSSPWDPEITEMCMAAADTISAAGKVCMPLARQEDVAEYYSHGARMFLTTAQDTTVLREANAQSMEAVFKSIGKSSGKKVQPDALGLK